MRALVVEDTAVTRRVIAGMVRDLGFLVTEAADGRQALEQLQSMPLPALALVDWNMPVLDGLGLVRAVRAEPRYDGVRLVVVTTRIELEAVAAALEAGADEYLMKPFSLDMLADKLGLLGLGQATA